MRNPFKKKLRLTGYIYEGWQHSSWGDSITWSDFDKRRMTGWLQRRPKVGDEIRMKMESGKVARFGVTSVEYVGDPRDMWFASVTDIGYVDEPAMNPYIKEAADPQIEPREPDLRLLI